ncbi:hypothetical protein LINPERHAP1_LOCUS20399 [Linum perenne]
MLPCIRKDTEIHCCKHGWLLLSRGERFFFYQPSTGHVIKLPDLLTGDCFSLNRMSFSDPPTSPGCVVFGIVDMFHHVSAYICFLRRGDTEWTHYNGHRGFLHYTKRNFSNNPQFAGIRMPSIPCKGVFKSSDFSSTPVFHNGGFYFIGLDGVLGVFNPRAKKRRNMWRILNHTKIGAFTQDPFCKAYLAESCKGELISLMVGGETVRVFVLDEILQRWRNVSTLGDQVIFLSRTSSVVMQGRDMEIKGFENTIHFPSFDIHHRNCNVFYSLSTRRFHTFEGRYGSEDLCDTEHLLNSTWLLPNFQIFSDQQLDWSSVNHDVDPHAQSSTIHPFYFIRELKFLQPSKPPLTEMTRKEKEKEVLTVGKPWVILRHGSKDKRHTFLNLSSGVAHTREILNMKTSYGSDHRRVMLANLEEEGGECVLLNTTPSMPMVPLPNWGISNFTSTCCLLLELGDSELVVAVFGYLNDDKKRVFQGVHEIDYDAFDLESLELGYVERNGAAMFCRVGDEKWTTLEGNFDVHNVVYYKGKIYGIGKAPRRAIKFLEIELEPNYKVQVVDKIEFPVYAPKGSLDIRHNLIESCGELLLFRKCFFGYCSFMDVLVHMVVFRVDVDAMRLEEVDDLGDRAFFFDSSSDGFGCCASQLGFE